MGNAQGKIEDIYGTCCCSDEGPNQVLFDTTQALSEATLSLDEPPSFPQRANASSLRHFAVRPDSDASKPELSESSHVFHSHCKFSKGDRVQVWSDYLSSWFDAEVTEAYYTWTEMQDFDVAPGTFSLRLLNDGCEVWIMPEQASEYLRKAEIHQWEIEHEDKQVNNVIDICKGAAFIVTLHRHSDSDDYGARIDAVGPSLLRVTAIYDEGMVPSWNSWRNATPWLQVFTSDLVEDVNGVRGDSVRMLEELNYQTRIVLTLKHSDNSLVEIGMMTADVVERAQSALW